MSGKISYSPVVGCNGKVSLYMFSIALYSKVCSLPLSHHCSVRGVAVVGFATDKGCSEHLAKMRHIHTFTSEKHRCVELNTLHIASPP